MVYEGEACIPPSMKTSLLGEYLKMTALDLGMARNSIVKL